MMVNYCFLASDILKFHPDYAPSEQNLVAASPVTVFDVLRTACLKSFTSLFPITYMNGEFPGLCLRIVRWNNLTSYTVNPSSISTSLSLGPLPQYYTAEILESPSH